MDSRTRGRTGGQRDADATTDGINWGEVRVSFGGASRRARTAPRSHLRIARLLPLRQLVCAG